MRQASVAMPGRYAVVRAVIEETGWSWRDVMETPDDLIEEILHVRNRRMHWQSERDRLDAQARGRD